jgi:putative DNA primase/helicase
MTARLDIPAVNARLAERIADLARELVGADPTSRTRDAWRFYPRGGLVVVIAGPKRGVWHDHGAGKGGDALGLVAHLRGIPMREALRWALAWLGEAPGRDYRPAAALAVAPSARLPAALPPPSMETARRVWREAVAPAGTLVETYLASRGLTLPPDAPLAFHPHCPRGPERSPAMVALMTDPATAEPCGIHRTFLASDGRGKAPGPMPQKMMAGNAGVIRLCQMRT